MYIFARQCTLGPIPHTYPFGCSTSLRCVSQIKMSSMESWFVRLFMKRLINAGYWFICIWYAYTFLRRTYHRLLVVDFSLLFQPTKLSINFIRKYCIIQHFISSEKIWLQYCLLTSSIAVFYNSVWFGRFQNASQSLHS